jgi:hypothetical protein
MSNEVIDTERSTNMETLKAIALKVGQNMKNVSKETLAAIWRILLAAFNAVVKFGKETLAPAFFGALAKEGKKVYKYFTKIGVVVE